MLSVIAFHAGIPIESGGVAGVTLFFVLSGYLIGTVLMREREATGKIDVPAFFARRAWRLVPALSVVMVVLLVVRTPAGDTAGLVKDSLLTLTYTANWARSSGDAMGWWNHAWSLSVEEQFYLAAPIIILVIGRLWPLTSRIPIAAFVIAVVAAAVWRGVLIDGGAPSGRIYFGTDTRVDALLIGCLLAATHLRHPAWKPSRILGPVALVCFALFAILPMVNVFGPGSGYSVMGLTSLAVVVTALGDDQRWTGLSARPLVWLGERSYSLYLVHVPVFMYVNHLLAGVAPELRASTAFLVSVALSAVLFRYVERPLRYGLGRRRVANTAHGPQSAVRGLLRLGPKLPA